MKARRRSDSGPRSVSRDSIPAVAGNATAANTGPYTVSSFTQVTNAANFITISTPGTYFGIEYWVQVRVNVAGVIFRECAFRGPDPDTVTDLMGCVQNYGSNPKTITMYDSVIDPAPWVTVKGKAALNPYVLGWHGGQCAVYRTEFVNCQDAINHIGTSSSTLAIYMGQSHLFELCWIHKGYYINDFYDARVLDGQVHCDGFQSNYGRNLTIRGCTIGGTRDSTGYLTWPGGFCSGDDFWNSAILLNQETANDDSKRYENVLIDNNLLGGGNCTLNHTSRTSLPNTWASTTISNNVFLQRATSWGYKLKGDGPGQTPYRDDVTASTTYVLKGTNVASTYSNNTVLETGSAVTISNGGIQG